MSKFQVDTTVTLANDGHTSLQEAFAAAVAQSVKTGTEVTITFASAIDINLAKTLVVPKGADVVLDGRIAHDTTTQIGTNDVRLFGDNGTPANSTDAYGHTMITVAKGGTLHLTDIELANNVVQGAVGTNGVDGDTGLNGNNGQSSGLPGSSGNGGLTVSHNGGDGQDAVSGIMNRGTVVLDQVNMNGLKAYAGAGGAGGNGGNGGDGGNGNQAPAGSGGPGGSGTGHGGLGGSAAAGVMNYGNLTVIDTMFQSDFVKAGIGGAGGSGGTGGKGGAGTIGGFGGNGGSAGDGANGGDAAVTVLNKGTLNVDGGWVYNAGSNLIWDGSGAAGAAGSGGSGGSGGKGSDMDGFDGTGGANGTAGQVGTSGSEVGWGDAHVAAAYYITSSTETIAEYGGGTVQMFALTIYRLGDTSVAGGVNLSVSGGTGGNIQGGLFSNEKITFVAGAQTATIYKYAQSDGFQGPDETYNFRISGATGGVLGGNTVASVTITNSDVVGTAGSDRLTGTAKPDVILGGAGNDTLVGDAGNDKLDGQVGFDTVDYSGVLRGAHNVGVVVDLGNFTATGRGIGTDSLFNIEAVVGSKFNDKISGDFNANKLIGGLGADNLAGSYGNDTLLGQRGNDHLSGGIGQDVLTGGQGADHFIFGEMLMATNVDHITDFAHGIDHIDLKSAAPFTDLTPGALDATAFHLGTTATTATQHILYDQTTGTLYYDSDGIGGADAVIFAILDNHTTLSASDFTVI